MDVYVELIMEKWRNGDMYGARELFEDCKEMGQLAKEEIEKIDKILPDGLEEFLDDKNNREMFNQRFLRAITKKIGSEDQKLYEYLDIDKKDLSRIREGKCHSRAILWKLVKKVNELSTVRPADE